MKKYLLPMAFTLIPLVSFSQLQVLLTPKSILIRVRQKKVQLSALYVNKTEADIVVPEIEPCFPDRGELLGNNCLLCFTLKTLINGDTTSFYPLSPVAFHQIINEPKVSDRLKFETNKSDQILIKSNSKLMVNYSIPLKGLKIEKKRMYFLQFEYFACASILGNASPTRTKVFSEIVKLVNDN
jgi:hypothetical protein